MIAMIFPIFIMATVSAYNFQSLNNNFDYGYGSMDSPRVPTFLSENKTFSAKTGADVTFPCEVDRKDGPYKMIFMYISPSGEDRIIYAGTEAVAHNPRISKEENAFVLKKVRRSDAGRYVCRFETNPIRQLVHILDVQYPAEIRRHGPETQKVLRWSKVTLKCIADGHPQPTVSWVRDEGPLTSKSHSIEGPTITFEHIERSEEGTYICTANNDVGEPASAYIKLIVEFKPDVTAKQSIVYKRSGAQAHLTCLVYGRPQPSLSWHRGDALVSSDKHVMTHDGAFRHTLTIHGVTANDFGEYTCKARNVHGVTRKHLVVSGLPSKPIILSSPDGKMVSYYTLVWEVESFAPIDQYRIRHRKIPLDMAKHYAIPWSDILHLPTEDSHDVELRYPRKGVFTMKHLITDLEPSEDYEVTVRVENKYGWSDESDPLRFYTKRILMIPEVSLGHSTSSRASQATVPLFSILYITYISISI